MKENDFVLLAVCQNGASGIANGKPWVSMLLSQNGLTTCNLPCIWTLCKLTFDATNQLANIHIICTKHSLHG